MREDTLKIFVMIFAAMTIYSFLSQDEKKNYNIRINSQVQASDGLNLKAVGELIKSVENAADLEKKINDSSVGINNLDLNQDKKVDYIKVSEYGDSKAKGFSLSVDLAPGDTQEVATIQVEKQGEGAYVEVRGNEQIYGQAHQYGQHYPSFGSMMLMSYLFRPHPFYYSPFGFGRYPGYYRPYGVIGHSAYRSNMGTRGRGYTKSANSSLSRSLKSPNAGRSSSKVKASLRRPTKSQKAFQTRHRSKSLRTGRFGRSRSRSRYRSSKRSRGFGRRSSRRSGFGFGRSRGFGRGFRGFGRRR